MEPMGPVSDWSWQTIASFKVVPTNGMPVDLKPPWISLLNKPYLQTIEFTSLCPLIELSSYLIESPLKSQLGGFSPPLWKMMEWKSVGIMTFPTDNGKKTCSKPPTSITFNGLVWGNFYVGQPYIYIYIMGKSMVFRWENRWDPIFESHPNLAGQAGLPEVG